MDTDEHLNSSPIRCAILGNAGGGKSILARSMASTLGLPLHELDASLWQEGWQSVPEGEFTRAHDAMISGERWVIDGFGTVESTGSRIERCTHVVYVDLPIWLHFALAAERQGAWRAGELQHPPGGQSTPPPTRRLFEMMWRVHTELAPSVKAAIERAARHGCHVEHVESLARLQSLQLDPVLVVSAPRPPTRGRAP